MSTWLALRALKFLALVALSVGTGVAVASPRQADRSRAALWLATPALFFAWLAGYGLLHTTGRSILDPFVISGVLASLVGLHGAVLCAAKPAPKAVTRWLGIAGLAVATSAMVARDASHLHLGVATVLGLAVATAILPMLPTPDGDAHAGFGDDAWHWFSWLGRLEGLSLLVLFGGMPLKRMYGIHLDGGTGALGWCHGALFLLYAQAVLVVARARGWSVLTAGLAGFSAFLPFGTFAFEAWMAKKGE